MDSVDNIIGERVALLDMGGTLVRNHYVDSTHSELNQALGVPKEQDKKTYMNHSDDQGELINHSAHAEDLSSAIRGEDTGIEDYLEGRELVMQDRKLFHGVEMFVDDLNSQEYTTVVLSSAPPCVTMPYAEEMGVDFVYKWKSFRFDDDGEFESIDVNEEAPRGKHEVVRALKEAGAEVAYAGNGANDVNAVKNADYGIIQSWDEDPEDAFEEALETFSKKKTKLREAEKV